MRVLRAHSADVIAWTRKHCYFAPTWRDTARLAAAHWYAACRVQSCRRVRVQGVNAFGRLTESEKTKKTYLSARHVATACVLNTRRKSYERARVRITHTCEHPGVRGGLVGGSRRLSATWPRTRIARDRRAYRPARVRVAGTRRLYDGSHARAVAICRTSSRRRRNVRRRSLRPPRCDLVDRRTSCVARANRSCNMTCHRFTAIPVYGCFRRVSSNIFEIMLLTALIMCNNNLLDISYDYNFIKITIKKKKRIRYFIIFDQYWKRIDVGYRMVPWFKYDLTLTVLNYSV